MAVANKLPDEPPKDCSEKITTIRFRCPEGRVITRRFLAQHPLQVLLNFVLSEGYHLEDYKVLSTFPRRDVSIMKLFHTIVTILYIFLLPIVQVQSTFYLVTIWRQDRGVGRCFPMHLDYYCVSF